MLNYSESGLSVRPAFFDPYNDIAIIVEDSSQENFYTQIVKNLIGDTLRIKSVMGMGGKQQVLKRLQGYDPSIAERKEFYLIDGDFDELLEIDMPDSLYLYRLERYDIESYLIEEIAICEIAEEENPHYSCAQYQSILSIDSWLADSLSNTLRLASCAAVARKLDERDIAVSQSIARYMHDDEMHPSSNLIEIEIQRVRDNQSRVSASDFDQMIHDMKNAMSEPNSHPARWISGKHILIPLLMKLLRRHTRRNMAKDSLCFRLAKKCDFVELSDLRDRILASI